MNKHKKQSATAKAGLDRLAFTLVELIVVITILAILGTIAFISLQGYSKQARDGTRISDLSSMKSSLELYQVDAGKYPQPTNGIAVTYSGATVWNQGTFGETVYTNVEKLDKIPIDPLTDNKYTYSVTAIKTEYQLGGILEGDEVVINPSQPSLKLGKGQLQANAGETIANAVVTGNYNGQITKSNSGSTCNILATPSIITNDTTVTDLQQIVTNSNLVYRGYKNLPGSFTGTQFKQNGGFAYQPATLLAYTDNASCGNITANTSSGTTARVQLLKGIQDAYTGTIVKNVGEIKSVLDLSINTSSPSQEVVNYAGNFINNSLGGNIVPIIVSIANSCNSTQPTNAILTTGSPSSVNQAWQSANPSNACYFTCSVGYGSTGTTCSNVCTTGMTELTLSNGQTWSCMNLGATTVRDGGTNTFTTCTSSLNCLNKPSWFGDYYQWGRNEPVNTVTTVSAYNGTFTGLLGHNNFVRGELDYADWWQNEAGNTTPTRWTGINPQGPCAIGWHVPSKNDWQTACNTISGTSCSNNSTTVNVMKDKLKLPFSGSRGWGDGYYYNQSTNAYYWASTSLATGAYIMYFTDINFSPLGYQYRSSAYNIRCLKN